MMSWCWLAMDVVASVTDEVNHFQEQDRREDEQGVVLDALPARDQRDEHDVDDHLEEGIEGLRFRGRVRATLVHVGRRIADQPLA